MKKIILAVLLLVCVLSSTACGAAGNFVGKWVNTNEPSEMYEYKSNGEYIVNELVFDETGAVVGQMVKEKGIFMANGNGELREFNFETREIKEKGGVKEYTGKVKSSGKPSEFMYQFDSADQITRAVPVRDLDGNITGATKGEVFQRVG
jgi:hypothetical protein